MDSYFSFVNVVAAAISFLALLGTFFFLFLNRKSRSHQENKTTASSLSLLSPSSSLPRHWRHHVFPSFHGPDVRRNLLCHVLAKFRSKGINAFIDSDMGRSKTIRHELKEAIRGSRIVIVFLSKNYASSAWCLNELVEIMECTEDQTVMSVFYEVDPTDIEKQTGYFGEVFKKTCIGKTEEAIRRWKHALMVGAKITSLHSRNWKNDTEMIEAIVTDVSNKLNISTPSGDSDGLGWMEYHMRKIRLLRLDSDENLIVDSSSSQKKLYYLGPLFIMDSYISLANVVAAAISFSALLGTIFFMFLNINSNTHQENKTTASSLSLLSPPTSLPPHYWKYHVFPSFHGPDVRKGFLSHFLKEFKSKGINAFVDNDMERSKTIGHGLTEAIRGSKIAIVLLSKNYASSTWCLNELVEIMKRREELGQTVIPLFYEVDPTDIKKLIGDFGKVFRETCKGKTKEEIRRLESVLRDVAQIAGYHSKNWGNDIEMIEDIVTDVSDMLNTSTPSSDFDGLVGMESQMIKMGP